MTKTLTQEVFKGAPEWVRSAAVDRNGRAWGYVVRKSQLEVYSDVCFVTKGISDPSKYGQLMICLGEPYVTTNWQNSAIDRE